MLILDRYPKQKIRLLTRDAEGKIVSCCEFKILELSNKKVKLGFEATPDFEIWRTDVPHIAAEDVSHLFQGQHHRKPKPESEEEKAKEINGPAHTK